MNELIAFVSRFKSRCLCQVMEVFQGLKQANVFSRSCTVIKFAYSLASSANIILRNTYFEKR